MLDILKSDLPLEYQNFWYDMGVKVQKHINGVVQVLFDSTSTQIIIKVFIEKFNFGIYFSFPYRLTDKEILQHILNGIQLKVYEEVFKK
jgi:hypothetical protein